MKTRTHTEDNGLSAWSVVPALTLGISLAVGSWIAWFFLHLPALATPPVIAAPVIAGIWFGLAVALSKRWGVSPREGLGGGLIAGVASLLLLGSMLVRPSDGSGFTDGEGTLRAGSIVAAVGFLLAGGLLGLLGAALGGRGQPGKPTSEPAWRSARLAWAVAASFVPLLLIGGVVTSTESGMAVRDWPSTFGANMFLYPQELMQQQPRVYYEHMHRLFGSLVGVCTLTLWITTLVHPETRRRFGIWATVLFLAVGLQGYLGGQRVLLNNPYIGALHGVFGQVVFAFAATLALWMSPLYRELPRLQMTDTRRLRVFATFALHATLVQLVFGAVYRHLRRGENPGASHVVWAHIGFSLVVVAATILAGAMLIRTGRKHDSMLPQGLSGRLRRLGAGMHGVVGFQFALGWVAFLFVMTGTRREGVPTSENLSEAAPVPMGEVLASTVHQGNGALLLLLVMLGWAWARRLHRSTIL